MDLNAEKKSLIDWINSLNDETTIERLKLLKDNTPENDWWDELSSAEIASIERGKADAKAKRLTSHEDVKKRYEKWL